MYNYLVMSINEWIAVAVGIISIITGFGALVKWIVKQYLSELKTNGGSSLRDQVNRLEARVDDIYSLLINK